MPRLCAIVSIAILAAVAAGCGSSAGGGSAPLPLSIDRQKAGTPIPAEPCSSWISPGIDAAFCATGQEAPGPTSQPPAVAFTGTPRSGAANGIAQAAGVLPEGHAIGVRSSAGADGTLIVQGICANTLTRATFGVHFDEGDTARITITRSGDTPVILLTRDGRDVPPDHELLVELDWMKDAPSGCAFRVA